MSVTIESNTIIEAARLALYDTDGWDQDDEQKVHAVLAAVTPLIRAQALEQAAKVAEDYDGRGIDEDHAVLTCEEIAAAIRSLKEQP
jgi:hypothetical protein